MITTLVDALQKNQDGRIELEITRKSYDHWLQYELIVDKLKGRRTGESFCRRYGITDYILLFSQDHDNDLGYIRRNYVR